MNGEITDEDLMLLVVSGNVEAFSQLLRRHLTAVTHFLETMVNDRTVAEDLAQDCFVRVWKARERYRPTAQFRTWLFTIARRLALDHRKQCHLDTTPWESQFEDRPEETLSSDCATKLNALDPQTVLLTQAFQEFLHRGVQQLPASLHEVLILRDTHDLSYEAIAHILQCPIGTVKSRLNVARAHIRRIALEWLNDDI